MTPPVEQTPALSRRRRLHVRSVVALFLHAHAGELYHSRPGTPKKSVTFPRRPHPSLSPTPAADARPRPHACAVSSHDSALATRFRPRLLNYPHMRAIIALGWAGFEARPREGSIPLSLSPRRGKVSAIPVLDTGMGVPNATQPLPAPCPLLPRGGTLMPRIAHGGSTDWRRPAGATSYGLR